VAVGCDAGSSGAAAAADSASGLPYIRRGNTRGQCYSDRPSLAYIYREPLSARRFISNIDQRYCIVRQCNILIKSIAGAVRIATVAHAQLVNVINRSSMYHLRVVFSLPFNTQYTKNDIVFLPR